VGKRKVLKEGVPSFSLSPLSRQERKAGGEVIHFPGIATPLQRRYTGTGGNWVRFLKYGIGMLIGAGAGGFIGYLGQCAGST
jgi:hypothetical protein